MFRNLSFLKTRATVAALAVAFVGLAASGTALAKCGDVTTPSGKTAGSRFAPALFHPDSDAGMAVRTNGEEWFDSHSIVGLWEFEVHLDGAQNGLPDHAMLDWGLATWHEDETEIQYSGSRAPGGGDVCMGAWQQVGKNKYRLHHIALGLTPATAAGTYVGPTIIKAEVTVNGDSYSGWYTLATYPGSPDDGTEFNESGKPLVAFTGTVTAKRVHVR